MRQFDIERWQVYEVLHSTHPYGAGDPFVLNITGKTLESWKVVKFDNLRRQKKWLKSFWSRNVSRAKLIY